REVPIDPGVILDAAVEHDGERREIPLKAIDVLVAKRRHRPVLTRGQASQECLAGVHKEDTAASVGNRGHESSEVRVIVDVIHPDARLDGHWNAHGAAHHGNAAGDEAWLLHQAGTECAFLDALARTADV